MIFTLYSKMVEEYSFPEGTAAIRDKKFEERVYGILDRMKKEIRVKIPKKDYPQIWISKELNNSYNLSTNNLFISLDKVHSGSVIGEEISHFIRDYLIPPESTELHSGEFFGYLGQRILKSIVRPEDKLEFETNLETRKEALVKLRRTRKDLKNWRKYENGELKDQDITPEKINKGISDLLEYRKDILKHWRPYDFSSKVDLEKVELSKLYALPDKEVRKRFFRENPEYDLLQQSIISRIRRRVRKGIENLLQVFIIPVFIITILLAANMNLTGRVIGISEDNHLTLIFVVALLIISILIIYLKFSSNQKNSKT